MGRLPCLYQQLLSVMQLSCLLICLLPFDKLVIFVLLGTCKSPCLCLLVKSAIVTYQLSSIFTAQQI